MSLGDQYIIRGRGDRKRQLEDNVGLQAGVDPIDPSIPRFVPITARGLKIDASGGFELPKFNDVVIARAGATNNIQTLTYKLSGVTVAVLTLSYVNGAVADNDTLSRIQRTA